MKYKELVLAEYPELTCKTLEEHDNIYSLFYMGEEILEGVASYSAMRTWRAAYNIMQRGEFEPYRRYQMRLDEARGPIKLTNCLLTDADIERIIKEVKEEFL